MLVNFKAGYSYQTKGIRGSKITVTRSRNIHVHVLFDHSMYASSFRVMDFRTGMRYYE